MIILTNETQKIIYIQRNFSNRPEPPNMQPTQFHNFIPLYHTSNLNEIWHNVFEPRFNQTFQEETISQENSNYAKFIYLPNIFVISVSVRTLFKENNFSNVSKEIGFSK